MNLSTVGPNKTASTRRQPQGQDGVGLIEILIAVLVLSIGLLGIALTQTRSLSANNSSMARSMAVLASYSILDAMRADRSSATSGDYNTATPLAADDCPDAGTLAETQLASWCNELGFRLGASSATQGAISCDGAGDCTITIQFDDSAIGAGGNSSQQVITRAML